MHFLHITRFTRVLLFKRLFICVLLFSSLLLLFFSNCCLPEHPVKSAHFLTSVAHPERAQKGKAPQRITVNYTVRGRAYRGDVYLPAQPRAGILFVPGAVEKGKDDPRVAAFANALARADFAVLVPDLV